MAYLRNFALVLGGVALSLVAVLRANQLDRALAVDLEQGPRLVVLDWSRSGHRLALELELVNDTDRRFTYWAFVRGDPPFIDLRSWDDGGWWIEERTILSCGTGLGTFVLEPGERFRFSFTKRRPGRGRVCAGLTLVEGARDLWNDDPVDELQVWSEPFHP